MTRRTPEDIVRKLTEEGFDTRFVGGVVRDKIMSDLGMYDGEPSDYDIVTTAHPEIVLDRFDDSMYVHVNFSVAVYVGSTEGYTEVVTARKEGNYEHGKPQDWKYVDDIELDLARRDATMNAMTMDLEGNVFDPFGGVYDIKNRVVRAVGNPEVRIKEHPIRIMRYLRLATKYGMTIEDTLLKYIFDYVDYLALEPYEAIYKELMKGLEVNSSKYFRLCLLTGVFREVLPEIDAMRFVKQNKHHSFLDLDEHVQNALKEADAMDLDPLEKFAVMIHDIGKPVANALVSEEYGHSFHGHAREGAAIAKNLCSLMRMSNEDRRLVCVAVERHMDTLQTRKAMKRFINRVSQNATEIDDVIDRVTFVLNVMQADRSAIGRTKGVEQSEFGVVPKREILSMIEEDREYSVKQLDVNGNDIMEHLNLDQGPIVGYVLEHLLDLVMSEEIENEREALLNAAIELQHTNVDGGRRPEGG